MEQAKSSNPQASNHKVTLAEAGAPPSRFSPFVATKDDATHRLLLKVDGIHCARCIWAIESALQKEPSISHARVNMSTNRLTIEWNGDVGLAENFASTVEALGYNVHPFEEQKSQPKEDQFLLRCVAISGFSMANIMLLSVSLWSSKQQIMGMATSDLLHWVSALIAMPTVIYAGRPFFRSAFSVLRQGHTNMDVPISLALVLVCAMSLFETINHGEYVYFDSAVMLLFFLLVGRWLDARARGKARENAESLLAMMQGTANIVKNGKLSSVTISALQPDMQIRIMVGEKIPTDAEIIEGESEIDTSLVTGETMPRVVKKGDNIFGGTTNLSAPITCRVLKASEDSLLADIVRLMENAEQGRARYVRLADKAASLYTPVVHSLAAITFIGWIAIGGLAWQGALLIAVTTLIITCPCALGLAVPVVQVLTNSTLMKRGILVKSGDALERLAAIDVVVFDKTGTLTQGKPQLLITEKESENLPLAASIASYSQHPLSQTLQQHYKGELIELSDVQEIAGMGVEANWQGKKVRIGRRSWCGDTHAANDTFQELWLECEGKEHVRFTFSDPLRDDAKDAVQQFKDAGITPIMLSGDRENAAKEIARQLDITDVHFEYTPADKVKFISGLKAKGHHVLMVGDGLNDAPALTAANVSLSPSSAMDITQNSADIVFQGGKLAPVITSWKKAHFSTRLVKQNFGLAIIYNCVAVPLAIMGYVTPFIAAIAMSSSSLIVIANSFRIHSSSTEKR